MGDTSCGIAADGSRSEAESQDKTEAEETAPRVVRGALARQAARGVWKRRLSETSVLGEPLVLERKVDAHAATVSRLRGALPLRCPRDLG